MLPFSEFLTAQLPDNLSKKLQKKLTVVTSFRSLFQGLWRFEKKLLYKNIQFNLSSTQQYASMSKTKIFTFGRISLL